MGPSVSRPVDVDQSRRGLAGSTDRMRSGQSSRKAGMASDRIAQHTPDRAAILGNLNKGSALGRIVAGFVMGGLTLASVLLTTGLAPIGVVAFVHPMVKLIVSAAAIATVVIAGFSSSVRRAWGRLCLMNGIATLALAGVSVEDGQPVWPM